MSTFVALLRGINLGGKNSLAMTELAAMFESLGCKAVRTYIQSGNVVFEASETLARRVPQGIARAIVEEAGLNVPVVMRSAAEFASAARKHPFLRSGVDPKQLHVAFLAETPSPARVAMLDAKRSPPDEFVVRGREIYLRLPNGVAKSKLTNAYFDAKLGTVSTLRNLATVTTLVEMCEA